MASPRRNLVVRVLDRDGRVKPLFCLNGVIKLLLPQWQPEQKSRMTYAPPGFFALARGCEPSVDKWNQFLDVVPIREVRLTIGLLQPLFLNRDQSAEQHHVDDEHRQETPRLQQAG